MKTKEFSLRLRKRRGLLIVITAALLLELLSAAGYYHTHHLMEDELEKRAEMELTMKAIIMRNMIEQSERILKSHIMEVKNNLGNPDSLLSLMAWTLKYTPHLKGCGIAFEPGFYHGKGELFEPYALRTDSGIKRLQVAAEGFDYTKDGFYKDIQEKKANSWVGPYNDVYLKERLISYAVPIYDFTGDTVAVFGIDIDTNNLGDTLNYRHIYPSSFDFLLTKKGELIAGPTDPGLQEKVEELVRIINDSTIKKSWSTEGRVRTTTYYDKDANDELSIFFANLKGEPHWQIAVVCYDDEAYAPLLKLRLRLLLFSLLAFGILLYMIHRYAQEEKQLNRKTREQERTNGELRIANNIQQTLLPANEASLKSVSDIRVEGRLIPAKAVGGDLYNTFVRDGKLFFCIGDVSGKGIPSALIMAIMQALFRNIASREDNPAQIMRRLNETACRNNEANIFVTLFIGVLDLPTGHLRFCNAGHEQPIIIKSSSLRSDAGGTELKVESSSLDMIPNIPVGLFDDFNYEMQTTVMQPGSALFLYTDGLTEARNAKHKMFRRERVMQMITDSATTDPKQLVETAISQWRHFIGTTEQSDDLTLLAICYTPSQEQDVLGKELTLKNDVKEVETLGSFVKQVCEHLNIDKSLTSKLRLAVEEVVVNAMEYAYPKGMTGDINIRATSNGQRLTFTITDSGIPFNPTDVPVADTTLSVEERPIGGLGILLVRQLMDSINYERIDGKNVLTLNKTIHS